MAFDLDPRSYKDLKTPRGFTYHYYTSAPTDATKPTLLFLHGFPSEARDWAPLIAFFQAKGYGIVAPDMLGYGGTDKPTATDAFRAKFLVEDVMAILDAEKVESVVVIAHDWGCTVASRLANYHPERFRAFAFLAATYMPPTPDFDLDAINAQSQQFFGYTCFGYWKFIEKENASDVLVEHIKSFISLGFAKDAELWKDHLCAVGGLEKWLLEDRTTECLLSEKEFNYSVERFKREGFASSLNWYKALISKLTPKDDAEIPKERIPITKPVFYGSCLKDKACVAAMGEAVIAQTCPDATVVQYDTGHWVIYEAHEKLSEDLLTWVEGKVLSAAA